MCHFKGVDFVDTLLLSETYFGYPLKSAQIYLFLHRLSKKGRLRHFVSEPAFLLFFCFLRLSFNSLKSLFFS